MTHVHFLMALAALSRRSFADLRAQHQQRLPELRCQNMTCPANVPTTGDSVRLWTLQGPDHLLCSGRIDHARSRYKDQHITAASRKLLAILDEDQIIWCYTQCPRIPKTSIQWVRWELSVPLSAILRFIDGYMWNRLSKQTSGVPVPARFRSQWMQNVPADTQNSDACEAEMKEEFWKQPESEDERWKGLFVPSSDGREGVDALLRHPIDPRWVICQEDSRNEDVPPRRRSRTLRGSTRKN
jgi:hypothetical protein